jgi:hypothetical protein
MFGQLKGTGLDGQRFDALSRLVATGMPRRRVLGFIGGGLAAIVSRVTSVSAGCLGEGSPCLDDITCCPGLFCDLGAVAGTGTLGGGVCTPDIQCKLDGETCGILPATVVQADCCDGLLCIGNVCTTPAPVCSLVGESCSLVQGALPSCCDGLVCMDGTCVVPAPACAVEGEACSMAEGTPLLECCDGGHLRGSRTHLRHRRRCVQSRSGSRGALLRRSCLQRRWILRGPGSNVPTGRRDL